MGKCMNKLLINWKLGEKPIFLLIDDEWIGRKINKRMNQKILMNLEKINKKISGIHLWTGMKKKISGKEMNCKLNKQSRG